MKNLVLNILLIVSLLLPSVIYSQRVEQPIKWEIATENAGSDVYVIRVTGKFDYNRPDWHIYDLGPYTNGPTSTSFSIEGDKGAFEKIGNPDLLSYSVRKFDNLFGMEIGICEEDVIIVQKIKITSADSVSLFAVVEWQACDDQSCLPPTEQEFGIKLPGVKPKVLSLNNSKVKSNISSGKVVDNKADEGGDLRTEITLAESLHIKEQVTQETDENATTREGAISGEATASELQEENDNKSLWGVILEALIWGFVALLTPCVFPMVPMTVSFFLKQSQDNKSKGGASKGKVMASFFGLSIITLYTLPIAVIILITYFAGGEAVTADIFNWLATHWIPNVLFFIIFMVFAASFFGAFEIVLPSWMVNKSDVKSDKGGYAGVFFMALTLVLVSFSCTGPIVGTILIKSTRGEIWEPIITMLAFSTAFALPFTIFAFAPSLLKDLPKSGGWLNSVKVVLGFIEVALGFKFLSVADQVYHWGILDREVYLAIWIVTFTLMGLYLLGKLRFAHDTPQEFISVKRLALSVITFTFVVYMIPGMWGAPLKALSGYLPPMSSQDFRASQNGGNKIIETSNRAVSVKALYSDFLHLPHGLDGFFRYEEGMEYARKVNKPVFIDFTGHGCVNCREMEARVWSDTRILKLLKEKFVIIALYADDKKEAIESDWITTENGRVLKSIGKINSHLAMTKYNVNAQPYYALINPKTEEHLTSPRGYNLDAEAFVSFLEEGLVKFR